MTNISPMEKALVGKVIARANLENGAVVLTFTDGTSFERDKTYEGVITATLRQRDGTVLMTTRI
ncbi:MAG: hypothetical protein GX030_00735 [Firmicutes bacterium]|nr:hypothetical protein [Bacillota bacterium]